MRNVHTIKSGSKVNNRAVVLTADTIQTGDGFLAINSTIKKSKHSNRNVVVSSRRIDVALVEDEDDEPTSYELELGRMAKSKLENEQEEKDTIQRAKEEKARKVVDKIRTKYVKQNAKFNK